MKNIHIILECIWLFFNEAISYYKFVYYLKYVDITCVFEKKCQCFKKVYTQVRTFNFEY